MNLDLVRHCQRLLRDILIQNYKQRAPRLLYIWSGKIGQELRMVIPWCICFWGEAKRSYNNLRGWNLKECGKFGSFWSRRLWRWSVDPLDHSMFEWFCRTFSWERHQLLDGRQLQSSPEVTKASAQDWSSDRSWLLQAAWKKQRKPPKECKRDAFSELTSCEIASLPDVNLKTPDLVEFPFQEHRRRHMELLVGPKSDRKAVDLSVSPKPSLLCGGFQTFTNKLVPHNIQWLRLGTSRLTGYSMLLVLRRLCWPGVDEIWSPYKVAFGLRPGWGPPSTLDFFVHAVITSQSRQVF